MPNRVPRDEGKEQVMDHTPLEADFTASKNELEYQDEAIDSSIAQLNDEVGKNKLKYRRTPYTRYVDLSHETDDVRSSAILLDLLCDMGTGEKSWGRVSVVWEHDDAFARILVIGRDHETVARYDVLFGA